MPVVTIDGAVKAIRTNLRQDANKEPLVVAQVVIEFPADSAGQEAIGKLAQMQDGQIRRQITDVQLELPRAAKG